MTTAELLDHLDGVRRAGRGWLARCPAHEDRSPSLSIAEGERGVLLRCFAGCELAAICSVLGITVCCLFYDDGAVDPRAVAHARRDRAARESEAERERRARLAHAAGCREAQLLIDTARGVDPRAWSDAQLARELDRVADAYEVLAGEFR